MWVATVFVLMKSRSAIFVLPESVREQAEHLELAPWSSAAARRLRSVLHDG
jgi:hypothetical protein